jgi:hypothetical protein
MAAPRPRRILLLILVVIAVRPCLLAFDTDTLKVLFIGNSYTYTNNMPSLLAGIVRAAGQNVVVDVSAQGGYTLSQHTTYAPTLAKLATQGWHYVILQEHSQIPAIDYYRRATMWPAALQLSKLARAKGARIGLYMTWGRKLGGQQCISTYCSVAFRDFFQMQDTLASAYDALGRQDTAIVVPVGKAWALAFSRNPSIDLWDTDNSHPTLKGSYLTACVFYTWLFKGSPEGNSFTGGLDTTVALFLQRCAFQVKPGLAAVHDPRTDEAHSYHLFQNYPNPFNPKTRIGFSLEQKAHTSLRIFDLLGRKIATLVEEELIPGTYEVEFDGARFSSGVYFYRLESGSVRETRSLIIEM